MASVNVNIDDYVDVDIDAEQWFRNASEGEKQEMRELLNGDNQIVKSLETNHFLKQNVVFPLEKFNETANITALSDLINNIKDL